MKQKKFLLLFFFLIMFSLILGAVSYLQSRSFANFLKSVIADHLPKEWGIEGNFSSLELKLLPPGIALIGPEIKLKKNNVIGLPEGSEIRAESVELRFRPIQMLSGQIRIDEVAVVKGDVNVILDPSVFAKKSKSTNLSLTWQDIFEVQADSLVFEQTKIHLKVLKSDIESTFQAELLKISLWNERGLGGIELESRLRDLTSQYPAGWKIPNRLDRLDVKAKLTSLGLQVDAIDCAYNGLSLNLKGTVGGDFLNPTKLPLRAYVRLGGEVEEFEKIVNLSDLKLKGHVSFEGRAEGDLMKITDTLSARGKFKASQFHLSQSEFGSVEIDGKVKFSGGQGAGLLTVDHAKLTSPTEGPLAGGTVELSAFSVPLGKEFGNSSVSTTINLDQAHIHWIAAEAYSDVYPLDFKSSGKVQAQFTPGDKNKSWKIETGVNLKIGKFLFTNQKYGVPRPMKKILDTPPFELDGKVDLDSGGLKIRSANLKMAHSLFKAQGQVTGASGPGYDIRVEGDSDLSDFGKLADSEVKAQGNLKVHIAGPGKALKITFDHDLKNAEYLNLLLGDVKGQVVLDDERSILHFNDEKLIKGLTFYRGGGHLDLNTNGQINLAFDVLKGDVRDLSEIFHRMTSQYSWYPDSLTGQVEGKILVQGPPDLAHLKVLADLRGREWEFYGEKAKRISLQGGYDSGRYYIERGVGEKGGGSAEGSISFQEGEGLKWKLYTKRLELKDFESISKLNLPIRGSLNIASEGKQEGATIHSKTEALLNQFQLRNQNYGSSRVTMASQGGKLDLEVNVNSDQGILNSSYDFNLGRSSSLEVKLKRLNFTPILLMINPSLLNDDKLNGKITGSFKLNFLSGRADLGSGEISIQDWDIEKSGIHLSLVNPVSSDIREGTFDLSGIQIKGDKSSFKARLQGKQTSLSGSVEGNLDLAIAELVHPVIQNSSGQARLEANISGTLKEPTISGTLNFERAYFRTTLFESAFENTSGDFQFRDGVVRVKNLSALLAGGIARASGQIDVYKDRYPKIDLQIHSSNNKLKIFPFQYVGLNGRLSLSGERPPYLLAGDLYARSGLIKEDFFGKSSRTSGGSKYLPSDSGGGAENHDLIVLKTTSRAGQGIWIRNQLFDAEMKGKVEVTGTIDEPKLFGEAQTIRGTLRFKDHIFNITTGEIFFEDPEVFNPRFNLIASARVKGTDVRIFAYGYLNRWKIELTSDPVLPEQEIISLLALGVTQDQMRKFRSGDAYVMQQGEAASLVLDSLGLRSDVKSKTGFDIQLEESVARERQGTSIFRPSEETEAARTAVTPKIVIKRRIGKNLNVSIGKTVGTGSGSQQEGRLEIEEVLPGLSVIGIWNNYEGSEVTKSENSYGVDLKFEKRFK